MAFFSSTKFIKMKTRFYFLLNGFTAFIAFFPAQITHLIIDLYKIDGNSTPAPILNRKTNVFKLQPKYTKMFAFFSSSTFRTKFGLYVKINPLILLLHLRSVSFGMLHVVSHSTKWIVFCTKLLEKFPSAILRLTYLDLFVLSVAISHMW